MMGRQDRDQRQLFYEFSLDEMIPKDHLLRRINVFATAVLADLHEQLTTFYSDIGRPSVDPELMIRMLLVGYCYGIRHERRLCQEVGLHLAYRWFCKLDLKDKVPHHSTFVSFIAVLADGDRSDIQLGISRKKTPDSKTCVFFDSIGQNRKCLRRRGMSVLPINTLTAQVRFVPCVDGSGLARAFFTFCSVGRCSHVFGLLVRFT